MAMANDRPYQLTDYEALKDYEVMVRMVRRGTDGMVQRTFIATLPATDTKSATRGGLEFGYAIGEASKWEWKFAGLDDGDVTVSCIDEESTSS